MLVSGQRYNLPNQHSEGFTMEQHDDVSLRAPRSADISLLRQWESDPTIACWLGTTANALDPHESPEQEFDRLLRTPRIRLLAILRADKAVVGFIRLHDLDQQSGKATLRIFIGPPYQQQGYATAGLCAVLHFCFAELRLHRVGLVVRADNDRAIAIYRRLGFQAEGRERHAIWIGGQWIDFIHFGLLQPEFTPATSACQEA